MQTNSLQVNSDKAIAAARAQTQAALKSGDYGKLPIMGSSLRGVIRPPDDAALTVPNRCEPNRCEPNRCEREPDASANRCERHDSDLAARRRFPLPPNAQTRPRPAKARNPPLVGETLPAWTPGT